MSKLKIPELDFLYSLEIDNVDIDITYERIYQADPDIYGKGEDNIITVEKPVELTITYKRKDGTFYTVKKSPTNLQINQKEEGV